MSIIVNIVPVMVMADQVSDANQVIDQCNKTVETGEKVINLKTREVSAQQDLIALQDTQIKDLSSKQNSIFSNPWVFFALGVVTSAVLIKK